MKYNTTHGLYSRFVVCNKLKLKFIYNYSKSRIKPFSTRPDLQLIHAGLCFHSVTVTFLKENKVKFAQFFSMSIVNRKSTVVIYRVDHKNDIIKCSK